MADSLMRLEGITKRFPGVLAVDHVSFAIDHREVHAVIGENGAGKSTLKNILFGLLQPDEVEIYIGGKQVTFRSPLDAIELGIGMVHQDRTLVSAHTVIENIILGHPRAEGILDLKQAAKEINELCDKYGFKIDLRAATEAPLA